MKNAYRIRAIIDEIEALEREIEEGIRAWESNDDPCAMASCDPSDQYVKSEEITALKRELLELVSEI